MPEEQTPAVPAQESPAPTAPAVEAPPWGTDFDASKAWSLVQNLRADKEKLAQRPVLSDEQKQQLGEYNQLVQASKSDAQRLEEAARAAQSDAELARSETVRYKVAATYGISAEHFDLLGSGTEAEITARAERLAALVASKAPVPPTAAPSTRPVAQLRPGATPGEAETEDDVLYAQLFGK
jgi:hypothetical protein